MECIPAASELLPPAPPLSAGRLYVLIHPHPRPAMLEMAAQLALHSGEKTLRVLDAGNWFNAYAVAARLRQLLPRSEQVSVTPYLARIRVARAFTCYQAAALLEQAAGSAQPGATLVLDLLGTFHDENVKYAERLRLLRSCLPALRRLRSSGPVLACSRPGDPLITRLLVEAADALVEAGALPDEPLPEPPSGRMVGQALGQPESRPLGRARSPDGQQLSFWEE